MKTVTLLMTNSITCSPLRRRLLLVMLSFACFWVLPTVQAVSPAPDGGYPNGNTAEGAFALQNLTTGVHNTADGFGALFSTTSGSHNTADGDIALASNTQGDFNTATGAHVLVRNTTGNLNIALGFFAGQNLTTGDNNIDIGNGGVAAESNTTRIGFVQTRTFIAGIRGRTTGVANA